MPLSGPGREKTADRLGIVTFCVCMTLGADKGRYDFRPMDKWWRPRRLALVVWLQSLASEYFTRPLGLLLSRAPERCKVP